MKYTGPAPQNAGNSEATSNATVLPKTMRAARSLPTTTGSMGTPACA